MADPAEETVNVDLAPYMATASPRQAVAGLAVGRLTLPMELHVLAQTGYGLDPRGVPVAALQVMGTHPAVYLAERTISGIVRRPDLYSVKVSNPALKARVEAFLWPLLPALTAAAARGFAYGCVAQVLDWGRSSLAFRVQRERGAKARLKTIPQHTHYVRGFELHPDETLLGADEQGRLESVAGPGGKSYGKDRVVLWSWDPEFGELVGQGARRRAWRSYCEWLIVSFLRDKYLERGVDPPRVSHSPPGNTTVAGVERDIQELMGVLLDEMRASGSLNLPSKRDAEGNLLYDVRVLELPDRSEAYDPALNRLEAEIFLSYLVSSTLSGGLDEAGGAASRTLEGMLREHVEDLASWVATGLTDVANRVLRVNPRAKDEEDVEVVATDVGKATARKIMMEVLRLATSASRGEVALLADLPAMLDKLGVPLREEPPEFPPGWGGEAESAGKPGRPREELGDREQRREDAATEEGEEDTGAPRDEDGEQQRAAEGSADDA